MITPTHKHIVPAQSATQSATMPRLTLSLQSFVVTTHAQWHLMGNIQPIMAASIQNTANLIQSQGLVIGHETYIGIARRFLYAEPSNWGSNTTTSKKRMLKRNSDESIGTRGIFNIYLTTILAFEHSIKSECKCISVHLSLHPQTG
jgi:hypothetical protein